MKKIIFFLFITVSSSSAQFFELAFEDTIGQIDPQTKSLVLVGQLINISNDTLHAKMVRLQNDLPSPLWTSSICFGLCFGPGVDSVTTRELGMPIPPGDSILTEIIFFQGDTIQGIARVQIKYATLDGTQVKIQWFEAQTLLNDINKKSGTLRNHFRLYNNYPNPFNNQTIISAQIDKPSKVTLQIFDILGREVFNAFREFSSAGQINFRWNGINNSGEELSSGIYYYRITEYSSGEINHSRVKKMTFLK